MKKLLALSLSLVLFFPSLCLAGNTKLICGNVKQTFDYKAKKKNIKYRYAVIEEYDTIEDIYDKQLPYGLYMFKVDPKVEQLYNCFEIDMQKKMIVNSTVGG